MRDLSPFTQDFLSSLMMGFFLSIVELEWKLSEVGAIQTDLEENPQKGIADMMVSSIRNISIYDNDSSNSDNDAK